MRRLAPQSKQVVVDVPHLRIVEDDVWFAAQARLEKSRNLKLHKRKRPKHLLSGRLVCKECGNGYVIFGDKRYGCSGHTTLGICNVRRRFGRGQLEACILNLIANQLLEPKLLAEYLHEYETEYRKQSEMVLAEARSLGKRSVQIAAELGHLMSVLKKPDSTGAAASLITAEINKLSAEKEDIEALLTSARSTPVRPIDIAEIEQGLRNRLAHLQKELEGSESEAASAREAVRTLIDRVVIAPLGDPKSRTGSMSIRVEGKITTLLGFCESEQVHAILSCTSPRAGQYRVKDQWSVSTVLEPAPIRHSDETRRRRLAEGTLKYDRFLLDDLGRATSPLTAADLARNYLCSQNEVATEELVSKRTHTLRLRLHVLHKQDLTAIVRLPGKERQGWVLAERKAELDRPLPRMNSRHRDNDVVFAELNLASRPLTINDFVRAVIRHTGERPTASRLNTIQCRLRICLKYHREAGLVVPVNTLRSNTYGWVLAEREQEFRPASLAPVKEGLLDKQILALMASADGFLTADEIAAEIFRQLPPPQTKRVPTMRSVTNRVWTFLRNHRRNGTVRPVIIKGKKAQGWQWVGPSDVPSNAMLVLSAAPPREHQGDRRAGV